MQRLLISKVSKSGRFGHEICGVRVHSAIALRAGIAAGARGAVAATSGLQAFACAFYEWLYLSGALLLDYIHSIRALTSDEGERSLSYYAGRRRADTAVATLIDRYCGSSLLTLFCLDACARTRCMCAHARAAAACSAIEQKGCAREGECFSRLDSCNGVTCMPYSLRAVPPLGTDEALSNPPPAGRYQTCTTSSAARMKCLGVCS